MQSWTNTHTTNQSQTTKIRWSQTHIRCSLCTTLHRLKPKIKSIDIHFYVDGSGSNGGRGKRHANADGRSSSDLLVVVFCYLFVFGLLRELTQTSKLAHSRVCVCLFVLCYFIIAAFNCLRAFTLTPIVFFLPASYTHVFSRFVACACVCVCNCSHNTRRINKRWEFVELFTKCLWVRARDLKQWSERTPRTEYFIRIHIYLQWPQYLHPSIDAVPTSALQDCVCLLQQKSFFAMN